MHLIYVRLSQCLEKSRVTELNKVNSQSSEAQVKVKCFLKLTKDFLVMQCCMNQNSSFKDNIISAENATNSKAN